MLGQRLVLWSAVWRLAEGLPASTEVAVAKLWAADAAHRLAHTTVHVHGGVGIDLDGEAHRYFTTAKRFEFAFGSATEQALSDSEANLAAVARVVRGIRAGADARTALTAAASPMDNPSGTDDREARRRCRLRVRRPRRPAVS